MIHHFKPAITSIMAAPIGTPASVGDIHILLGAIDTAGDIHADRFTIEPSGAVVVGGLENTPVRYGSPSDPAVWWLCVDSSGSVWFTTENPYDNPDLVPAQSAR